MRPLSIIGIYLLMASAAPALRNNEPETWPSPNGKYTIKETFYGEGKLVRSIFVHLATGQSATIYPGGARTTSVLWSPDSHYVALTADRTKYRCEVKLFRVENGKISEIALPPKMDAKIICLRRHRSISDLCPLRAWVRGDGSAIRRSRLSRRP